MRSQLTVFAKTLALCLPIALFFGIESAAEDLVPLEPGTAPNYWCTWGAQNDMFRAGAKDPKEGEGANGAEHARGEMSEQAALTAATPISPSSTSQSFCTRR